MPRIANILEYITPRSLAAYLLRSRFGDPGKVNDKLIDQWYDMWLREGQRAAILARLRTNSDADLVQGHGSDSRAHADSLGREGAQVRPSIRPQQLRKLLVNAPEVKVITYPGVGHMVADEAGPRLAGRPYLPRRRRADTT